MWIWFLTHTQIKSFHFSRLAQSNQIKSWKIFEGSNQSNQIIRKVKSNQIKSCTFISCTLVLITCENFTPWSLLMLAELCDHYFMQLDCLNRPWNSMPMDIMRKEGPKRTQKCTKMIKKCTQIKSNQITANAKSNQIKSLQKFCGPNQIKSNQWFDLIWFDLIYDLPIHITDCIIIMSL